jgi:hypothetical protein
MKNFTKEKLATLLNNREYLNEVPDDIGKIAAENGLVIVFGAFDNICEFRGAINDKFGALEGSTIPIDKYGIVINECDDDRCPYYVEIVKQAAKIKPKWFDGEIAWTFETDIPYATFDIYEDGDIFCRGIVFSLNDVD